MKLKKQSKMSGDVYVPNNKTVSGCIKSFIEVCKNCSADRAFPTAIKHRPASDKNERRE